MSRILRCFTMTLGALKANAENFPGRPRSSGSLKTVFGHSTLVRGNNSRGDTVASKTSKVQNDSEMAPPGNDATSTAMNQNTQMGAPLPLPVISARPVKLSPEQESVLQRVRAGQNVFFTGSAGQLVSYGL
jgi:hypothetical protein